MSLIYISLWVYLKKIMAQIVIFNLTNGYHLKRDKARKIFSAAIKDDLTLAECYTTYVSFYFYICYFFP